MVIFILFLTQGGGILDFISLKSSKIRLDRNDGPAGRWAETPNQM
jgi:hypothetical protein